MSQGAQKFFCSETLFIISISLVIWASGEILMVIAKSYELQSIIYPATICMQSFLYLLLLNFRTANHQLIFRFKYRRLVKYIFVASIFIFCYEFSLQLINEAFNFDWGNFQSLIWSQKWFFYFLILSLVLSLCETGKIFSPDFAMAGSLVGLFVFALFSSMDFLFNNDLILRFIGCMIGFVLFPIFCSYFQRKFSIVTLLLLNGPLIGSKYYLSDQISTIGVQESDHINLSPYHNVNASHAKLITYGGAVSIVDNDPYRRTTINFNTVNEKIIKNGDILGIGHARFLVQT